MALETSTTLPSKGEQTRQSILDAAVLRFAQDGYRATSVADIARDAGVGGTVAYTYFVNKEALFFAAVDQDAAAVILEGVSSVIIDREAGLVNGQPFDANWRQGLFGTLLGAVNRHPLARRLLAGLEPEVTARVYDTPALVELRHVVVERMRLDQQLGLVRPDIDAELIANGAVTIMISLLITAVQLGPVGLSYDGADIAAFFQAAIETPVAKRA